MSFKGNVKIFLEKPYYLSGELVVGRADLEITDHVKDVHKLMIKWKGFERTLIENTVTQPTPDGNKLVREKHKQEHVFFKQELVLASFHGDSIPPSRGSYPFSFQLPQGIPSVFHDERQEGDGDKIKAAVVYKVKCWLDMKGKDIKRTEKMVITEAVTKAIVPIHEEKKKSFLLTKGELKLKVDLDKNVYVPGEVIPIKVSCHNETTKVVDALKVKLMRKVIVRAHNFKKEHIAEIHRMKYDGVGAKSNKDIVLNFQLDPKVYPSTDGKLVDCEYHLDIECDVAMAFDLEVHPKVKIALLPAPGQPVYLYDNYGARAW